jgi:hypothetical protein
MFQFFYQYRMISGVREFATIEEAAIWADEFIERCPGVTIVPA